MCTHSHVTHPPAPPAWQRQHSGLPPPPAQTRMATRDHGSHVGAHAESACMGVPRLSWHALARRRMTTATLRRMHGAQRQSLRMLRQSTPSPLGEAVSDGPLGLNLHT